MGPMAGEHVELVEAALVEEVVDALAGEHLALRVLALDGALASGVQGRLSTFPELLESCAHRAHGFDASCWPMTPRGSRPVQGVVVSVAAPSAATVVGTMVEPVVPTMLVGTAGRVVDDVGVEPSAS